MWRADWVSRSSTSRPSMRKALLEHNTRCGLETRRRFLVDLSAAVEIRKTLFGRVSGRRARVDLVRDVECRAGVPGQEVFERRIRGEKSGCFVGSADRGGGAVH